MSSYVPSYFEKIVRSKVQHYDEKKYWMMRKRVMNYQGGVLQWFICNICLYRIKKCDAFNNASLGTFLGSGAVYRSIPKFPHGLYGIVISGQAEIGENCTIYHQVTIGTNGKGVPKIGDNVIIGAGAKIIGPVRVGNGVHIGANVVITQDIPDGCVVVCDSPKIIDKTRKENDKSITFDMAN